MSNKRWLIDVKPGEETTSTSAPPTEDAAVWAPNRSFLFFSFSSSSTFITQDNHLDKPGLHRKLQLTLSQLHQIRSKGHLLGDGGDVHAKPLCSLLQLVHAHLHVEHKSSLFMKASLMESKGSKTSNCSSRLKILTAALPLATTPAETQVWVGSMKVYYIISIYTPRNEYGYFIMADSFSSADDRYTDTDFLEPIFGVDTAFAPSIYLIKWHGYKK